MTQIYIPVNEAEKLATYYIVPENGADYTIIICHGFRGSKENQGKIFEFARRLNDIGFGVLAFDFRGVGNSSGNFTDVTLSRQVEDLQSIIKFARENIKLPIFLMGRSFGGTTVLAAAGRDVDIKGFIFWSTPISLRETFMRIWGPRFNELVNKGQIKLKDEKGRYDIKSDLINDMGNHNFSEYCQAIDDKPVLIIQGKKDEVVSESDALFIEKNCPGSRIFMIEDADHQFSNKDKLRENITVNWLKLNLLAEG